MLVRILGGSFGRQKRRKVVAFAAVGLGTAAASALLNMALGVGDQLSRELRSFGANLAIYPAGTARPVRWAGQDLTRLRPPAYLEEKDILRAKDNFWTHNILGVAPLLEVEAHLDGRPVDLRGTWFERRVPLGDESSFVAGVRGLFPFWKVTGRWPEEEADGAGILLGRSLAKAWGIRPGQRVTVQVGSREAQLPVVGLLDAGGEWDRAALTTLGAVQQLAGLQGRVGRILVSALTTPEDEAAARLGLDPLRLSTEEFEAWSCTPFVSSIAYTLELSVPGSEVRPIRRVAGAEGAILERIGGLLAFIAVMAGLAAALTVSTALTTGVLERRSEVGLLKALGATNARVVGLFLSEAALLGLGGGLAGGVTGMWLASDLSRAVFGAPIALSPLALPVSVAAAVIITLLGCALPARKLVGFRPFEVLHGL